MLKSSFFQGKQILIAGGTGLIGSHLSNKLELLGANVTSASIDSEERFKKALNNPSYSSILILEIMKLHERVKR